MFDFLKKKKAAPIFESLVADMHCHLIPCVDDGSKSIDETLSCLATMQEVGYKKVYITPHFQYPRFPNTEEDIQRRYAEVCKAAKEKGLTIEPAGIGGEYRIDTGFADRLKDPRFLEIRPHFYKPGEKGYVLVELSLHQQMMGVEELIYDLQMKDYCVILAHPERYPYLSVHEERMEKLKSQGVLFQTNILSLDGFYGESAMHKGYEMLDRGWVEMLGTDMHNGLYAQALIHATHNSKIEKVLSHNEFMNVDL